MKLKEGFEEQIDAVNDDVKLMRKVFDLPCDKIEDREYILSKLEAMKTLLNEDIARLIDRIEAKSNIKNK